MYQKEALKANLGVNLMCTPNLLGGLRQAAQPEC